MTQYTNKVGVGHGVVGMGVGWDPGAGSSDLKGATQKVPADQPKPKPLPQDRTADRECSATTIYADCLVPNIGTSPGRG